MSAANEATATADVTPQDQAVEEPAAAEVTADSGAAPTASKAVKKNEFLDKIKNSFDKLVHPNKHKASATAPAEEATTEPANAATE